MELIPSPPRKGYYQPDFKQNYERVIRIKENIFH
jgi:hypothetical protein